MKSLVERFKEALNYADIVVINGGPYLDVGAFQIDDDYVSIRWTEEDGEYEENIFLDEDFISCNGDGKWIISSPDKDSKTEIEFYRLVAYDCGKE